MIKLNQSFALFLIMLTMLSCAAQSEGVDKKQGVNSAQVSSLVGNWTVVSADRRKL